MKKTFIGSVVTTGILATLAYVGAHIWGAIYLYKSVKLWLFLVMLLVPGIGDIAAVFCLIKSGYWLPIILYVPSLVLWQLGGALAKKADE